MDRLAAQAAPRPSMALRAAWAASILVLLGGTSAAFVWRVGIIEAWPPAGRLLGNPTISTSPRDTRPPAPHAAAQLPNAAPQTAADMANPPSGHRPVAEPSTANQPAAR
jgi:hypothetical protein